MSSFAGSIESTLFLAQEIYDIKLRTNKYVIVFIDGKAVGPVAIIPFMADELIVTPLVAWGDIPYGAKDQMSQEEIRRAVESLINPNRSDARTLTMLADAMVDKDMIIVLRDHQIIKLNSEDDAINTGVSPDVIISGRGKLVTLNSEQLMDFGVADFEVPYEQIAPITDKEWDKGRWSPSKLLVFQEPSLKEIPNAMIINYQDWRVILFTILTHPVVASFLLIGLVVGFYIEINTPGFGIPGSIAVGCLALILLSNFASHAINWIEVLILVAGLILLALELFVIPGFGIVGILGIAFTMIGLLALLLPGIGELNFLSLASLQLLGATFIKRLAWLLGGLLLSIVMIFLMTRFYSHRFFRFSKLVLKGEQEKEKGYVSGMKKEEMPSIGSYGKSVTPLRPYGKVHIGENLYDAVCSEDYLEKNQPIEVVKIEGNKVVVKPLMEQRDFSC